MTLIYLLLVGLLFGNFLLYRMLTRMIKYQNFKSNVILRIVLAAELEAFKKLEDVGATSQGKRDEITKIISDAIDEEIDNEPIWNWKLLITAINAETYFRTELSEPFHRAFFPSEIIKRHLERNKEYIPKK